MLIVMWVALVIILAVYVSIGALFRVLNARRLRRSVSPPARGPRHGCPVLVLVDDDDDDQDDAGATG